MIAHVDPERLDGASGDARRTMLEHVRGCASCRRTLALHDPTLLFGLLALQPVPQETLDEVSARVARRVGTDPGSRDVLVEYAFWPRRVAAAALFALVLLSGYVTLHDRQVEGPPVAVTAPPAAISPRADVEVQAASGLSQVVDLTVGETQIVMVYNGDLHL